MRTRLSTREIVTVLFLVKNEKKKFDSKNTIRVSFFGFISGCKTTTFYANGIDYGIYELSKLKMLTHLQERKKKRTKNQKTKW